MPTLLAHVIGTKTNAHKVTDVSMSLPSENLKNSGHQENGSTLCVHSLAVRPEYQRKGLGTTLMKDYVERMEKAEIVDRCALLAHGHLIKFYEHMGFCNVGESDVKFGGGGWVDMVRSYQLEGMKILLILKRSCPSRNKTTVAENCQAVYIAMMHILIYPLYACMAFGCRGSNSKQTECSVSLAAPV